MMLKDILMLLCIHPKKGWMRKSYNIDDVLLAAAACDLALSGRLSINDGKVEVINTAPIGDPLLDELLNRFAAMNGSKYAIAHSKLQFRKGRYYRMQMDHLIGIHKVTEKPMLLLGITWGRLYRVIRPDELKPIITAMDRVLTYGRTPQIQLKLIIEWLRLLNLLSSFYPDGELRSRSKSRAKSIARTPYPLVNDTLKAIQKQARIAVMMGKG